MEFSMDALVVGLEEEGVLPSGAVDLDPCQLEPFSAKRLTSKRPFIKKLAVHLLREAAFPSAVVAVEVAIVVIVEGLENGKELRGILFHFSSHARCEVVPFRVAAEDLELRIATVEKTPAPLLGVSPTRGEDKNAADAGF